MVKFDRKQLINSQSSKLNKIYKDTNFFVWLGWSLITVVIIVIMYFYSINIGLWIEAVVTFGCAMYYMIMSFVKERIFLGYYLSVNEIEIFAIKDGVAIKEVTNEQTNDFLVSYEQIAKVIEYKNYIVIKLKDEGCVTIPNTDEATEFKTALSNKIKSRYHVY